jgi:hypothetical protein
MTPTIASGDETRCAPVRCAPVRASDTRDGADSSGLERNLFGFVVRKRLNHAVLPALCKLEVAASIPARSTFSDIAQPRA